MHLNNVDVIILIIVGISALIALSRGLIKEVLSIIGWVLAVASIIYLLPVLSPIAGLYIESGLGAGIVTSLFILIVFLICWILLTGKIVGKIRNSKLSNIDRILGLFFGVMRAFLLVVLMYILINWIVPSDKQAQSLRESKYFNIAGEFAKPIEGLIPESTLQAIRERTQKIDSGEEGEEKEKNETSQDKNEIDELFNKLARPQIEKKSKEKIKVKIKENLEGYNKSERDNLDRLIENAIE